MNYMQSVGQYDKVLYSVNKEIGELNAEIAKLEACAQKAEDLLVESEDSVRSAFVEVVREYHNRNINRVTQLLADFVKDNDFKGLKDFIYRYSEGISILDGPNAESELIETANLLISVLYEEHDTKQSLVKGQ